MLEYNADPVMEELIHELQARLPYLMADEVEAEKRARSIVIAGVTESSSEIPSSRRQVDLEDKVAGILDVLDRG
ncbi:hypothetical protein Y032_0069g282 [Ancylostoma ceylanicum]|uniref:Uncharacterized protein n=1 Tax=Ancylostoma ceylanicum TaxID=53326 RepID=A0A016TXT9_9BILA|nr:hypothetical protein Y032_0069g282 [Ancylostoma ceylanicum]